METTRHTYTLEAEGDPRIWQRMNVHLHLYSFDEQGAQQAVESRDNGAQRRTPRLSVTTAEPAAEVAVCLYVVPCDLPESKQVSDSPPLKLRLRLLRDGEQIATIDRNINQFGGDQLIGQRYK